MIMNDKRLNLLCMMLVFSLIAGPASAEDLFESPLQPPDTSSPRATLQSLLENVSEAYNVLMPAYESYRSEPSLFPPESAREAEARAQQLLDRAVRTLNLSEITPAVRQRTGLERAVASERGARSHSIAAVRCHPGQGGGDCRCGNGHPGQRWRRGRAISGSAGGSPLDGAAHRDRYRQGRRRPPERRVSVHAWDSCEHSRILSASA